MINIPDREKKLWLGESETSIPIEHRLIIRVVEDSYYIPFKNYVGESLDYRENLCQQKNFKFGLAEGNSLILKTLDVDDLTGKHIEVSISASGWEGESTVQLGTFKVQSHKRTAGTSERTLMAYTEEAYIEAHPQSMAFFRENMTILILYHPELISEIFALHRCGRSDVHSLSILQQ